VIFLISILVVALIGFSYPDAYGDLVQYMKDNHAGPQLLDPNFKIQLVANGLDFPTRMNFVDGDILLISQKADGKVRILKNFNLQEEPLIDLNVESGWERGFTGIISTKHNEKTLVFVYYTGASDDSDTYFHGSIADGNKNNGNKLIRYEWNGQDLVNPKMILHPIKQTDQAHHGGAMVIKDEFLYLIVGNNQENTGLLTNGKGDMVFDRAVIFRVDFDGNPHPENPFKKEGFEKYFGFGVRNGYGMTIDSETGNIWDTENSPEEFDEINLIYPGFNSGWLKIMGPNGKGLFSSPLSDLTSIEGAEYSDPEFSWKRSNGVTAIEFLNSNLYGEKYENSVFVGDAYGHVYRLEINENRDGFVFDDPKLNDLIADSPQEAESILFGRNLGMITDIKLGPDGYLYFLSMVQGDEPGILTWIENIEKVEEQGIGQGVLFRLIPTTEFEGWYDLPPRTQEERGIHPSDVFCKEPFTLLMKESVGTSACVKPTTAKKLIERGWGSFFKILN